MLSAQLPSSQLQVARSYKKPTWQTAPNRIVRLVFNLSTTYYGDLIQLLRNTLQQPGRYSHNRPVMPVRDPDETRIDWIELVLSTSNHTITLRIRQHDIYLVAYQMHTGGQWLEFGVDDGGPHQIPGSAFLGFRGDYTDLKRVIGTKLEGTVITRPSVLNAIDGLAWDTDGRRRARYLRLLILVVCEATRFEELSRRFTTVMHRPTSSETIDGWVAGHLITSWSDLSGRLIRADADGDQYFRLPTDSALRARIQNALDAARYLGLLIGSLAFRQAGDAAADVPPPGQPMMEVFSIQVRDIAGEFSCTILVTDGLGPQTLFSGQLLVNPGDTLPLKPLDRAISAWESVTIEICYPDQGRRPVLSWDIFQSNNPYAITANSTAVGNSRSVLRDYSIAISQRIFPEAFQIIWVVTIDSGDGFDPMNVYGSVKASYWYQGSRYEVPLFLRSTRDNAQVCVGANLPLSRYVTALPYDVDVTVDVDLKDYIHIFPDRRIAYGQLKWHVGDGVKAGPCGSYKLKCAAGESNSQVTVHLCWYRVSQTAN